MNWIKKVFHVHDWTYYPEMSIKPSKYNKGSYYYKCLKCGDDIKASDQPYIFKITEGRGKQ